MKKFSVGVIGWGFMGRTHAQALRSMAMFYPNCGFETELKCVCTRREEKAKEAARLAGFEGWTTDYREMLATPEIDVVSICTPNAAHEEMAIAALRAGKHVCLDKPVAVDGGSALRIAAAAEASSGRTRVLFHNRYYPGTLRMKQLIDEGRIGRIMEFEARYQHSGSVDPEKPVGWKQMQTGGALLDMGSHVLDLITWLLGYPVRAMCRTRRLYAQRPLIGGGMTDALGDDYVTMTLEMPDGALGTVMASKIATGSNDDLILDIRGEKGALRWNLMQPNYLEYYDATAQGSPYGGLRGYTSIETVARYEATGGCLLPPKNALGWDCGHMHCYYDFLNRIAHDLPDECTVADGARLQCLMDRLLISDSTGKWEECE